jgi:hypothetical protein
MGNKTTAQLFVARFNAAFRVKLNEEQSASVEVLLEEIERQEVSDKRQVAYILATAWHECRFLSVRERRARPTTPEQRQIWEWQNRYWLSGFYGRGFPQLTWEYNYRRFSPVVGIDLVKNPDEVLRPEIGAKILVFGMVNGSFTAPRNSVQSKNRLSSYIQPGREPDFVNARRIVNGTFQAQTVASHAVKILEILVSIGETA